MTAPWPQTGYGYQTVAMAARDEDGPDEPPDLAPPVGDSDCTLTGAGDGSVLVMCRPCRRVLAPRATTLNAVLGLWEEHCERDHEPPPEPAPIPPDPWTAQTEGPVPPPPF